MKKANFITNLVLVPLDFIVLMLAAISAYYFRFSDSITEIRPVFYEMHFPDYLAMIIKISIFAMIVFALSGFYTIKSKKISQELPKIITGVSTVIIFLILAIFFKRELFSSRFIIILAWGLAIVYLFILRLIVYQIRNYFLKKGKGLSKIVIIGEDKTRAIVVKAYTSSLQLGFKVIKEFNNLEELQNSLLDCNWLKDKKIDYLMQTDSSISKSEALDLLTFCQENHLELKYVASLWQTQSLNFNLNSLAGLPIIEIQGTPLDGWRRVAKRFFDMALSSLLIIILSPLFLILAIVIKKNSQGTVLVKLDRVGSKGRIFKIYKFRSMVNNAHQLKEEMMVYNERNDGPLFKMKNDPRITSVGRWLRKTSLDELPQLFNVFKGDMSLVGPRPHEPVEVSKYQKGYKQLLTIKPGMTGMAQVSGRSNLLFAEEAKLDIFYIKNWSMLLDLIILLKTPKAMFKGDQS